MVAVVDHRGVKPNVALWLNEEPMTVIYGRASYPRLANSYPLRKGRNALVMKSTSGKKLDDEGVDVILSFHSNDNVAAIPVEYDPGEGTYQGSFEAAKDYKIAGVALKPADAGTADFAKNWVQSLLEKLAAKDKEGLSALVPANFANVDLKEIYGVILKPEASVLHVVAREEILSLTGRSVVLVFGDAKLAEWQDGIWKQNLHEFMFCNTDHGVYVRVSEGLWAPCLMEGDGK